MGCGVDGRVSPSPLGLGSGEWPVPSPQKKIYFEFSSKNAGFYTLLLRKTTCGQNVGLRGLIDA